MFGRDRYCAESMHDLYTQDAIICTDFTPGYLRWSPLKTLTEDCMDILYVALFIAFALATLGLVRLGDSLRETAARK